MNYWVYTIFSRLVAFWLPSQYGLVGCWREEDIIKNNSFNEHNFNWNYILYLKDQFKYNWIFIEVAWFFHSAPSLLHLHYFFFCCSCLPFVDLLSKLLGLCTVSAFCDENEALSAFSSRPESFHIAIVEVMHFHFLYEWKIIMQ